MEQKLNYNLLQFFSENMQDAIFVTNTKGTVVYANKTAVSLLGFSGMDYTNKKLWELIPFVEKNDNFVQLMIDAFHQKKRAVKLLVDYQNLEGKDLKLLASIAFSDDSDGLFLVLLNDVTELIKVNAAFERYTSPEIAKYVLTTEEGSRQGGRAKEVSILMSDLRGFTDLSSRLEPMRLIAMLNHYFEQMLKVIRKYSGTVIEYLGDGIFVVFGAPADDPKHASHAVKCAIEMQNAMLEVNNWNRQEGLPDLEMGIGIQSGMTVVGNIGSDDRMKYGCMGQPVNLAGRVQGLTVGGQILITEDTRSLISESVEIVGEQSVRLKGASKPLRILDIIGAGEIHRYEEEKPVWSPYGEQNPVITFYLVDGKTIEDTPYEGTITHISADRRFIKIRTEKEMAPAQDIMIDREQNLYAKVLFKEDGEYALRFTSTHTIYHQAISAK